MAASDDETAPSPARVHAAAPPLPRLPPSSYPVERELSRGGHGRILVARDEKLRRKVALKELLRHSEGAERRFLREVWITAKLQHPSIIHVHDLGRWESGAPFYTMALIDGRSLAEELAAARTLAQRLAKLPNLLALSEAIAYAHARRVIHRDLKPHNVLIGAFGETVVIDWGLAKDLSSDTSDAPDELAGEAARPSGDGLETASGAVLGTPAYMPPEQAMGAVVDERADVYALGAILYELLSGQPPYRGGALEALEALRAGPPIPLDARVPGLPPELLSIVAKAMAREPAERYASAGELAAELRNFQTGQLVSTHTYTILERALRFARRHRAALAVAALAVAALAGTLAFDRARLVRERDRAEAALDEVEALQRDTERRREEAASIRSRLAALIAREPVAPEAGFSKSYLQAQMQKIAPLMARCYERLRVRSPEAEGKLVAHFQLRGSPGVGALVTKLSLEGDPKLLGDPLFEGCVVDTVSALPLEPPEKAAVTEVTYPFTFRAHE